MNTPTQVVKTHADGPIWVLTLNRPAARNAVNLALAHQVAAAMNEFDARPDLRICIITGEGGNFCAGMDLKAFSEGEWPFLENGGFAGLVERSTVKPVIAAVEGYALAGGFEIALSCDLVVASRSALFGIPEARRGLVAAAGGLLRLPTQLPRVLAMELALTGRMLGAEEAWDRGLINRLVETGSALDSARSLALEIAANAPMSVAVSKRIIRESRTWGDHEMFNLQKPIVAPVFTSQDASEGALAFVEKRTPKWTGR